VHSIASVYRDARRTFQGLDLAILWAEGATAGMFTLLDSTKTVVSLLVSTKGFTNQILKSWRRNSHITPLLAFLGGTVTLMTKLPE
jgi:hypothetical protein